MDTNMMDDRIAGAWSKPQPPTPEIQDLIDSLQEEIENKAEIFFDTFRVKTFLTQEAGAAGTNFRIKVDVGDDMYIHVRLFEDKKGKIRLRSVKINKTEDDIF